MMGAPVRQTAIFRRQHDELLAKRRVYYLVLEPEMESWVVQLLTLFGVVVGASASFISTRLLERSRWRREEALRWDSKRLECYLDFAIAISHYLTVGYRMTIEYRQATHVQALDAAIGLPELARLEGEVSEKLEQVRMLGSPEVVVACQEWRREAIRLDQLARGTRDNTDEYEQATQARRAARKRFYSAVRADLGIVSGELPSLIDVA